MKKPCLLIACFLSPLLLASTPPPPPAFVVRAANALAGNEPIASESFKEILSPSVTIVVNGRVAASGQSESVKLFKNRIKGSTIGFVENYSDKPYSLSVVDTYDSITHNDATFSDPRMVVRISLYTFNDAKKISKVQVTTSSGFWMTPEKWLPQ